MTLVGIAARNLVHRPWRSILTFAGVMLSIAAFVALIGLARGLETTFTESLDERRTDILMIERGIGDPMASSVPEALADEVALVPGVAAVTAELARLTSLAAGGTSLVMAWPEGSFGWETHELVRGRYPVAADKGGVVVGEGLALRLGLEVGDPIELYATPFTIVGLTTSESYVNRNMVIALLPDIQAQTYRQGQATAIAISLQSGLSPAERDAIVADLQNRFPGVSVEATQTLVQNSTNLQVARALAWSVSFVSLISAALAVMNTMAMAVNERRGEIAIMGAVGWPAGRIIACLLIEGAVLSLIGGAGGAVLGAAIAWGVAVSPQVAGLVEPQITALLLGQAVLLALLIGLTGSLLPAWRSTRRNPASILRGR